MCILKKGRVYSSSPQFFAFCCANINTTKCNLTVGQKYCIVGIGLCIIEHRCEENEGQEMLGPFSLFFNSSIIIMK